MKLLLSAFLASSLLTTTADAGAFRNCSEEQIINIVKKIALDNLPSGLEMFNYNRTNISVRLDSIRTRSNEENSLSCAATILYKLPDTDPYNDDLERLNMMMIKLMNHDITYTVEVTDDNKIFTSVKGLVKHL